MSAQPKDWAVEVAKRMMQVAYTRADAREVLTEYVREIWKAGQSDGFAVGQQSVIDFQAVVRNATQGQWP